MLTMVTMVTMVFRIESGVADPFIHLLKNKRVWSALYSALVLEY